MLTRVLTLAASLIIGMPALAYDASYFAKRLNSVNLNLMPLVAGAETPQPEPNTQDQVFAEMVGECKKTLAYFEQKAESKTARAEAWAIGGALAGLIGSAASGHAAPALIALLSGLSGVANTAQNTYEKHGDTPISVLEARAKYYRQAQDAVQRYLEAKDPAAKQNALLAFHAACAFYDITLPKTLETETK